LLSRFIDNLFSLFVVVILNQPRHGGHNIFFLSVIEAAGHNENCVADFPLGHSAGHGDLYDYAVNRQTQKPHCSVAVLCSLTPLGFVAVYNLGYG